MGLATCLDFEGINVIIWLLRKCEAQTRPAVVPGAQLRVPATEVVPLRSQTMTPCPRTTSPLHAPSRRAIGEGACLQKQLARRTSPITRRKLFPRPTRRCWLSKRLSTKTSSSSIWTTKPAPIYSMSWSPKTTKPEKALSFKVICLDTVSS